MLLRSVLLASLAQITGEYNMASYDGWSLNKKLEELKADLEHKYMALGLKLMQLEQRLDEVDAKKTKIKKSGSKRTVTTGDA